MDIPLHKSCSIIGLHDSGLIAIEKGTGIMSHPNQRDEQTNTLLQAGYDIETESYVDGGRSWYLLNRLDAPTSGVILLSDNLATATKVREAFRSHLIEKKYLAVVKGIPPRSNDSWKDCLKVIRQRGSLRTVVSLGRANAFCDVKLKQRGEGPPARALVELIPATGKTHQLRVQCANRRLPIIGDNTYGEFSFNREFFRVKNVNRLFLHSYKTRVHIIVDGKEVDFFAESPMPHTFAVALD